MSKTIFDQITDKLRAEILNRNVRIGELQEEIAKLREENNLLRQELEHKAFQDDF